MSVLHQAQPACPALTKVAAYLVRPWPAAKTAAASGVAALERSGAYDLLAAAIATTKPCGAGKCYSGKCTHDKLTEAMAS